MTLGEPFHLQLKQSGTLDVALYEVRCIAEEHSKSEGEEPHLHDEIVSSAVLVHVTNQRLSKAVWPQLGPYRGV
ncbi:MAG: hypothetical protein U0271_25270 [Polyangiaceae bacterium]